MRDDLYDSSSSSDGDTSSSEDDSDFDEDGNEPSAIGLETVTRERQWDVFQEVPPPIDSGSAAAMVWSRRFERFMLVLAFVVTFVMVLASGLISKGLALLMISQVSVRPDKELKFCNERRLIPGNISKSYEVLLIRPPQPLTAEEQILADRQETDQIAWIWCLVFAFALPEVFAFLRSVRQVFLKQINDHERKRDKISNSQLLEDFAFVCGMESCHVIGLVLLVFLGLPQLDAAHALVLTNCMAVLPSLLLTDSNLMQKGNSSSKIFWTVVVLDVLALAAQISGLLVWSVLKWIGASTAAQEKELLYGWAIIAGLVLTSFGWWENFVSDGSSFAFRWMHEVRLRMIKKTRYRFYLVITVWKVALFAAATMVAVTQNGLVSDWQHLFTKFKTSFDKHEYSLTETIQANTTFDDWTIYTLQTVRNCPLEVLVLQSIASLTTYIIGKFACKVQIQTFSFSTPINLVAPVAFTLIMTACGARGRDACAFSPVMPEYLFFDCPSTTTNFWSWVGNEQLWLWALWLLSQAWITRHIWSPKSPRLAATEKMFGTPYYCGLFIDQSMVLNRRRDGGEDVKIVKSKDDLGVGKVYEKDKVTRIYGCATMWHETKEEMMEMLRSVFRVDSDYAARRHARKFLSVKDPDYYEWETHIFFDDAFKVTDRVEPPQKIVNDFVKKLVSAIDEAASLVHCTNVRVKPPTKIPTPYGGKLIWTLPGKTRIVCHLKDKKKIRHKKRWSQVMYMYYLLGYLLVDNPKLSEDRKEARAKNTYLLALDGDIDFQPEAVTRLVDLMKKNKNLGAACGRILPTGSGFMVWYQMFEYAIGHWLQKSTEHVMGCVLCSPGCFSLFRGQALMDTNVMRKYNKDSEKPLDFVQYDQGEDRWLCTLLLQRGWRIEYSAASDAYTACPEGFGEFFNQRRRWMPSTIANIFDLLSDAKNVVKVNPDISRLYICYQIMMMVGTVIGPGTIFLMLVGAFNAAFRIANWTSFIYNLIPILGFMVICFTMDKKIQLLAAQLLSAGYALVMMAVLVGILLQISDDGVLAPTTMSIMFVAFSFILAGLIHPQEFYCLPYGVIYYITIPAMYLLLVIFSIFNLHDVSWGTREVKEDVKKTPEEMAEEQRQQEEAAAKAKNKKSPGLLGFLLHQANDKATEKGGFEFSLGNLLKCMCFTHEDEENPRKQLVKIAGHLDDVTSRLNRIENGVSAMAGSTGRMSGNLSSRRRSSAKSKFAPSVTGGTAVLSVHNEEPEAESVVSSQPGGEVDKVVMTDPIEMPILTSDDDLGSFDEEDEEDIVRDDLINPFWLEDKDLKNGKEGKISTDETLFWKDMIEKYLESFEKPLPSLAEKLEKEKKQKKQKEELKALRDQLVYSFFMLNAIFVLVVFLLQQEKDTLYIPWHLGAKASIIFHSSDNDPLVVVDYDYKKLEPIGMVFVVFFAIVLTIQVIGMLIHRWGTISHIISTTKMPLFTNALQPGQPGGEDRVLQEALAVSKSLQRPTHSKRFSGRKSSNYSESESDYAPGGSRQMSRRLTVKEMTRQFQDSDGGDRPVLDLQKNFLKRMKTVDFTEFSRGRVSVRRDTLVDLNDRRKSYLASKSMKAASRRCPSSGEPTGMQGTLSGGRENKAFDDSDFVSAATTATNSRQSVVSQFEVVDDQTF